MHARRRALTAIAIAIALLSLIGVFGYSVIDAEPASAVGEEFSPH